MLRAYEKRLYPLDEEERVHSYFGMRILHWLIYPCNYASEIGTYEYKEELSNENLATK